MCKWQVMARMHWWLGCLSHHCNCNCSDGSDCCLSTCDKPVVKYHGIGTMSWHVQMTGGHGNCSHGRSCIMRVEFWKFDREYPRDAGGGNFTVTTMCVIHLCWCWYYVTWVRNCEAGVPHSVELYSAGHQVEVMVGQERGAGEGQPRIHSLVCCIILKCICN